MAKRSLPSPLYKPGDVVFLKCSRKGLGIGNAIFGIVKKSRWHYGYYYWIIFQPKGLGQVTVKLYEGRIGPKAKYAEYCLEKKIEEIDSYEKTMAAYNLRDKKDCANCQISKLKTRIREDKKKLKQLKIVLAECNAELKWLFSK